jgi:hypothetical protein
VFDSDAGGGVDASPVPFNGMILQGFQGDESASHSNPGFVILDGSRAGGGAILVKTHVLPAADYTAGYRGASIVDTPSVDLERKLATAGTGNPVSPKQHPVTNALLKIDVDPAHTTFGKILASRRGTSDSYPLPKDRAADMLDEPPVAPGSLLLLPVRLQLHLDAEPVDGQSWAPALRRAAEVGRVPDGRHGHDVDGLAHDDRHPLLRLQHRLDGVGRERALSNGSPRSRAQRTSPASASPTVSLQPERPGATRGLRHRERPAAARPPAGAEHPKLHLGPRQLERHLGRTPRGVRDVAGGPDRQQAVRVPRARRGLASHSWNPSASDGVRKRIRTLEARGVKSRDEDARACMHNDGHCAARNPRP